MLDKSNTVICPFTILIDTAEVGRPFSQPWTFESFKERGGKERTIIVPTEHRCLGRHPNSLGDYSLIGGEGRCHIERKAKNDAIGTLLGWESDCDRLGRRERFESELANLAAIECGVVIVECPEHELWSSVEATLNKDQKTNKRTVDGTIRSYRQRFRSVQWIFAANRRDAERHALRWFERWWREEKARQRRQEREAREQREKPVAAQPVQGSLLTNQEAAAI